MNTILGLDIGGTKTAVVLGDHDARIVHRTVFETRPERGFAATWAELRDHIATAQRRATELARTVDAVSVSIGGPLQIEPGIIKSPPNLPGWDDIPLKQLLADLTGLPVYIEHDGNAGALAEWLFGAARGARNVIFLTMGTGFGGGLILNGQLYRGTCDTAGEVGHVRIADDGPVGFGKAGSWEGLCAGAGVAKLAAVRHPERWPADKVTARDVAEAALAGDAQAVAVLREVGGHLGRGLAILVDVLNPEVIVIGALAVRLGDLVLGPARQVLAREALPDAVRVCRVLPAGLGERIGDVACLCAAIVAVGKHA
ncbi:MAG TPA: ROK family protein [Phycisphaerae bacterium]|nr:ROK family protein [Phycisphaerae bacterium]HPM23910.1 ROK family protein [Phycisphaerae bacterium]